LSISSLEDVKKKLEVDVEKSISLFQLLLILEGYVENLESNGVGSSEIEKLLKNISSLPRILMKLASCRVDLIEKALRKDPRIKKLVGYTHVLMEVFQRECGVQTTSSIPSITLEKPVDVVPGTPTTLLGNKYELQKIIGEGGMGVVWLARDTVANRLVAIKSPKITGDPLKDDLNIRKVMVEAEVLKNLDHPYIVKFLDFFRELQRPYLVMEYVDGEHLEKRIKNPSEALEEKEAVEFTRRLVDAVEHMHSKNIVHRDLKPKNVFIVAGKESEIKVIDFGTAKYYHSQVEYGEGIFSPGGYTAPEQIRFMYSPQSDIWSLGGILFYTLTGTHPIEVLPGYPHVTQPPILEKIPRFKDIDPRIANAIRKAMDPDPVKRYLRAIDMIKDLTGQRDLSEATLKPKLIVLGREIEIEAERVVIGRLTPTIAETAAKTTDRVLTIAEGNNLYIYIADEKSYISRLHAELIRKENEWYIRDLGSLNKTAVLEGGEWRIIYNQYKVPSTLHKLTERTLISLGYDVKLGPYLVITFISTQQPQHPSSN
jgi:predicted Ser/Thr protein kinase